MVTRSGHAITSRVRSTGGYYTYAMCGTNKTQRKGFQDHTVRRTTATRFIVWLFICCGSYTAQKRTQNTKQDNDDKDNTRERQQMWRRSRRARIITQRRCASEEAFTNDASQALCNVRTKTTIRTNATAVRTPPLARGLFYNKAPRHKTAKRHDGTTQQNNTHTSRPEETQITTHDRENVRK